MVPKIALALCFVLLIGVLSTEAQRDGRRRSNRRKPTTESPLEESDTEKNPQKIDAEPEVVPKQANIQPIEPEIIKEDLPNTSEDKEASNSKESGPPVLVPRGTRKPRPQVNRNGEAKPKPTLPTFARKRGPRPDRRDFKKVADDKEESPSTSTTTTTAKPPRSSSRNRNSNSKEVANKNSEVEKVMPEEEIGDPASETNSKKRFGGGVTRRPSRGSRRYNPEQDSS